MGRSDKNNSTKKYYPLVSVCTPTFNRRPFIPIMFQCFLNQDYPKNRVEWIIVDDGSDSIQDLVESSGITQIKYFRENKKMSLGEKRNYMHSKAKGSILVYMDDDDYYPPERISHAVDRLMNNPAALCAGSSEIYIYFKHIQKMYQSGPYGPNHSTAGTFAFKSELLKQTSYENHAALAEEKHFLKNYTIPFVQLDPMKTILVFSHEHNTFDKRRLLENLHPDYFKESNKTVEMFIRRSLESPIKQFFMQDIDNLLKTYTFGEPKLKPDVLKQLKEIEIERKKMMEQQTLQGQFMMNEEGKPPRPITHNELVELMNNNIQQIKTLTEKNQTLEKMVANLQKRITDNAKSQTNEPETVFTTKEMGKDNKSNTFTDILLSRINELEKQISILKNTNTNNNQLQPHMDQMKEQIQNPEKPILQPNSKSTPEVIVDIHANRK
jgi:Glycosyl transferase family 2